MINTKACIYGCSHIDGSPHSQDMIAMHKLTLPQRRNPLGIAKTIASI